MRKSDRKKGYLAGVLILTFLFIGNVYAANWRNSWVSEKGAAKERCAQHFDDYQLQAVCMQNEKDGYDKMQQY